MAEEPAGKHQGAIEIGGGDGRKRRVKGQGSGGWGDTLNIKKLSVGIMLYLRVCRAFVDTQVLQHNPWHFSHSKAIESGPTGKMGVSRPSSSESGTVRYGR